MWIKARYPTGNIIEVPKAVFEATLKGLGCVLVDGSTKAVSVENTDAETRVIKTKDTPIKKKTSPESVAIKAE